MVGKAHEGSFFPNGGLDLTLISFEQQTLNRSNELNAALCLYVIAWHCLSRKIFLKFTPHNNLVPFFLKLSEGTILPREQSSWMFNKKVKRPKRNSRTWIQEREPELAFIDHKFTTCKVLHPMRYPSFECYCKLCDYLFKKEVIEKLGQE
jgi:hypothetical protein